MECCSGLGWGFFCITCALHMNAIYFSQLGQFEANKLII